MGGACGTHGERRNAYGFRLKGNLKGRDNFEDLGSVERLNFKTNFEEIGLQVVGWIYLAQATDRWPVPVSSSGNLRVS
jgi:hypothetical protein